MSYVKWKLEHTPWNNGWDDNDTTEITNFHDVIVNLKLGDGRDDFSFKVTNFANTLDNFYKSQDRITLSRVVNSSTVTTNDIVMVGALKDVPTEEAYNSNFLRIEGFNFSETVMSAITFVDLETKDIAEGLQLAIEQVGGANPNFQVVWSATNPTVKTDSTAFPTIGERFFNKTLLSLVEKYSTPDRTTDGYYFWYVDNANEFIWRPANDTLFDNGAVFNSSTDEYKKLKNSRDTKDVKNYIIIKGGLDPAGRQIQTRYIDWASIAKNGMKYKFLVSETNGAKNLIDQDLVKSYGTTAATETYPDLTSSFTTSWSATVTDAGLGMTAGSPVTINLGTESANKQRYVDVIRRETKFRLFNEAQDYARFFKFGKLQLSIEFTAGTKTWGLGEIVQCTVPSLSDVATQLRVNEIQYTSTIDTYTLIQDEGTQ